MEPPLRAAVEVLERRLDPRARAPLAVAVSGGGDSLALLVAARAFADRRGRPLVVLHVDHGLQPASRCWAALAQRAAVRVNADFRRLDWTGEKPAAGLPAAARRARHRLIAEAARDLGAPVVLMGHTLDDQLENGLMRADGAPMGPLHEWSPSPVWPEGRGLFLCRPLLAVRRADLRRCLSVLGWAWIDDPANADLRFARSRARVALDRGERGDLPPAVDVGALAATCRVTPWGGIVIDRVALLRASAAQALRLLQIALACAGGGEGLARPSRAGGLLARLTLGEDFAATLGGARIEAAAAIVIGREAGEAARGGLRPTALPPGQKVVWDGRFEIQADEPGWIVRALRGQAAGLCAQARARLREVPAWARPALPLLQRADSSSAPRCLALDGLCAHIDETGLGCRALCEERFSGAAGLVNYEVEMGTMARKAHSLRPHLATADNKD